MSDPDDIPQISSSPSPETSKESTTKPPSKSNSANQRWIRFPLIFVWLVPLIVILLVINFSLDGWVDQDSDSTPLSVENGETFNLPYPIGSGVPDGPPDVTPATTSNDAGSAPAIEPKQKSLVPTNTTCVTVSPEHDPVLLGQSQIQTSLQELGSQLTQLSATTRTTATRLSRVEGINDQISVLIKNTALAAQSVADINKRLGLIEKQLAPKTRRTGQSKTKSKKPPFKVVSIDHWGNALVAVVTMGDKSMLKSAGESLAGWSFVGIDAATRSVSVSKSGASVTLPVVQ